jgi:hypothetical protein
MKLNTKMKKQNVIDTKFFPPEFCIAFLQSIGAEPSLLSVGEPSPPSAAVPAAVRHGFTRPAVAM